MILNELQQATGIPVHLCNSAGLVIKSSQPHMTPGFLSYLRELPSPENPVLQAFPSNVWVSIAHLDDGNLLILGPVATREITKYGFCTDLSVFPFQNELEDLYFMMKKFTPVSTDRLIAATIVAARICSGQLFETSSFYISEEPIDEVPHERALLENRIDLPEEEKYHLPEEFLHNIFRCVKQGNFEGFLNLFKANKLGVAGTFSYDQERDRRYHFVYSTAIAHYAALSGGLDYEKTCQIAEYFCKKMDERRTTAKIEQLNAEMFRVFCSSVRESNMRRENSPLVSACISYVRTNIHKKLSVSEIADYLAVSAKWLSLTFQKETGGSLLNFIHSEKILEAKHLLKYTTYSIAQVSYLLSYGSESYFIHVFRSQCQMTPLEYRRKELHIQHGIPE